MRRSKERHRISGGPMSSVVRGWAKNFLFATTFSPGRQKSLFYKMSRVFADFNGRTLTLKSIGLGIMILNLDLLDKFHGN